MLKHHQNIFLWFKNNAQELLPKKIDKIRIGSKRDGGYVIPKKAITDCDLCVSFGLGNNIMYENHLILNGKTVIGYDVKNINKRWSRIMMLKTYDDFKNIQEVKQSNCILLKMDVEGWEWGFLETIDIEHFREKVHTFAFEIHFDRNPMDISISNIDKILKTHYVINIHPNNYGGYIDYVPMGLEITLINKKYLENPQIDEHPSRLDRRNTTKAPELSMKWINSRPIP